MTIKNKSNKKPGKIEIDLTGSDGNAFVLMGMVQQWCKQMDIDSKPIIDDMMSDDYEHLLSVIEKHFGDYIIMYR
jgi:hypothetical protein